ncbi:MAG: DUF2914 domain-containing protein [Candidatus Marinimicrobia bacterium]|nr:DUF2914 domain-containing protein [Candidatus Neomarinimicrobiota bacterium]MBL7023527.1 DUF2914 domain-containing protein [Candidatus Neomarinimicrobiota bacterium]MBL7109429.1 DUF2914 domain-containing protein [Candidatus Neomarinimicrobiota bacterium]
MKKNTLNLIITVVVVTALLLMAHACKDVETTQSQIKVIDKTTEFQEPIVDHYTMEELQGKSEEGYTEEAVEEKIIEPEIVTLSVCTDIIDREPVNDLENIELSSQKIYTHTVVKSSKMDTIFHVYKFGDEEIAKVALSIGESPRWRTWSSKYLDPIWVGDWSVEVQTKLGTVLATKLFSVIDTPIEDEEEQEEEVQEVKPAPESVSLVIETK